jgi:hypothetical protein
MTFSNRNIKYSYERSNFKNIQIYNAINIINNTSKVKLNEAKDKVNNTIEPVILDNNNMPISPPKLKQQENIS